MTTIRRCPPRILRGGLAELRVTAVTMTAVLLSFASVLLIEHLAHLSADVIVLAVLLAVALARAQRGADPRQRRIALALLPPATIAASGIEALMTGAHPVSGDALFVLAVAATIWIRRRGPRHTAAGTVVAIPLIATLVTPVAPGGGSHPLWAGLVATIALAWVTIAQLAAGLARFAPGAARPLPARTGQPTVATSARTWATRVPASTRMALQMGVALAVAFGAGHALFGPHSTWVVLTTYLVASGTRNRGDVAYRSVLRVGGAVLGTIAATGLGGLVAPHTTGTIVAIFAVLAIATWLRPFGYGWWACGITAALALLYGYFGQDAAGLLLARLGAILTGGLIGVAASWFVLPVRTTAVARRRLADALAALAALLDALLGDPAGAGAHQPRFDHAVTRLDQFAAPLRAHRRLTGRRRTNAHPAEAIEAVRRCVQPVDDIVRYGSGHPAPAAFTDLAASVATEIGVLRRELAHRGHPGTDPYARFPELAHRLSHLAAAIRSGGATGSAGAEGS